MEQEIKKSKIEISKDYSPSRTQDNPSLDLQFSSLLFNHKNFEQVILLYDKVLAEQKIPNQNVQFGLTKIMWYLRYASPQRFKDFEKVFHVYQNHSKNNHPFALFKLGECYRLGEGVTKNAKKAFKMYERSHFIGYEPASYLLAASYFEGDEVERDIQRAFEILRKLAKSNSVAERHLEIYKGEVDIWYHQPHPQLLKLLLLSRYFDEKSPFYKDYLPLDLFRTIWKLSQIGKFPSTFK